MSIDDQVCPTVIVGVSADPARARNWQWCRERLPYGWEIVECPEVAPWSKGRQYAPGVERASSSTLVLIDCDVYLDPWGLVGAASAVESGVAPWVMPHGVVYRLSDAETRRLVRQGDPPLPVARRGARHDGPVGGGCVVLARAAWETVGGYDPRFEGWGGEDESFGRALDTLVGPHLRMGLPCWHLWHRRMARRPGGRATAENERLAARYLDAVGDRDAMAALVAEHR